MQTPKRKPGKYTNVQIDPHITRQKFAALERELERLKRDQKHTAQEVARLAEFGDFSENHAYQMAKGKLRGINQRILDTEDLLQRAVIITTKKRSKVVEIGSTVTVIMGGKKHVYQLLGPSETDPIRGIISYQSPLGAALLGHSVGDTVQVEQGTVVQSILIRKIS